jgi:hypothetical protein
VHELIHAGQPSTREDDDSIHRALEEGLTETLAQLRTNKSFADSPTVDNLPEEHSYREFVGATMQLMDNLKIPPEARELFLEKMNTLPPRERLAALARLSGSTDDGVDVWRAAIG